VWSGLPIFEAPGTLCELARAMSIDVLASTSPQYVRESQSSDLSPFLRWEGVSSTHILESTFARWLRFQVVLIRRDEDRSTIGSRQAELQVVNTRSAASK
jgi:hypothetical protein